jgi:hypothetical protein
VPGGEGVTSVSGYFLFFSRNTATTLAPPAGVWDGKVRTRCQTPELPEHGGIIEEMLYRGSITGIDQETGSTDSPARFRTSAVAGHTRKTVTAILEPVPGFFI